MTTAIEQHSFLAKTYALMSSSLLVFAISILVGLQFTSVFINLIAFFGIFIIEIALIFAIMKYPSPYLLYIFAAATGLTTVPLMASVLAMASGTIIVAQAIFGTAIIAGGTSYYALTTKKDFSAFGPILFWALIAVIVISLINLFIGSTIVHTIISAVAILIFAGFMIYDTQEIIKGHYSTPVEAALSLYLNIINIFIHLLSLLSSNND